MTARRTSGSARSCARSTPSDQVLAPVEGPDVVNRCAALHDPVPQSLRQQELVCLTSGHVNCPRYLRGAVGFSEVDATVREGTSLRAPIGMPSRPSVSPAILLSLGVLAFAFLASVSFVLARGGLELTAAATPPPSVPVVGAVETATPEPSVVASASAVAAVSPTVAPTPSPTPEPTPSPTPSPTPPPDAQPDARADARAERVAQADVRPVRAAGGLSGRAALLDLHDPEWRQPVQHRQLLRDPARDGLRPQPVDPDREPARRPRAAPAAPDPLSDPRPLPSLTRRGVHGGSPDRASRQRPVRRVPDEVQGLILAGDRAADPRASR